MINVNRNIETNQKLKSLYEYYNKDFLKLWQKYYKEEAPCRMNEFGIIDPERYDPDNGILFICRETNGWSNEDFAKKLLGSSELATIYGTEAKWIKNIKRTMVVPASAARDAAGWMHRSTPLTGLQRCPATRSIQIL